jgi:NDP-sugar pyrophosphorylase family protein
MVLAAGQGTRLRPVTDHMPKALVPVAGRPMIEFALLLLRRHGVRDIIINLHHFGSQIEDHLGDGRRFDVNIHYSQESELLETGGGLLKAKAFLQHDTFIVINTDALIDVDLAAVLKNHQHNNATATLVLRPDVDAERYGSIDIGADDRVYRFLEHRSNCQPTGTVRTLMFTGLQILEPRVFDYMDSGEPKKFSTTRETYPRMLHAGERIFGYCFEGFWQDLGTMERITDTEKKLREGQAQLHFL